MPTLPLKLTLAVKRRLLKLSPSPRRPVFRRVAPQRLHTRTEDERNRIRSVRSPRRVYKARVHAAYGNGIDRVERVIDTLTSMARRNQITERQLQAGERFRQAFETVQGQAGGAMDFDRVRTNSANHAPPLAALLASDVLAEAKKLLTVDEHLVVHQVCGLGEPVGSCAHLFGQGRPAKRAAGLTLRTALARLACFWVPEGGGGERRNGWRAETIVSGEKGVVRRGRVYVG